MTSIGIKMAVGPQLAKQYEPPFSLIPLPWLNGTRLSNRTDFVQYSKRQGEVDRCQFPVITLTICTAHHCYFLSLRHEPPRRRKCQCHHTESDWHAQCLPCDSRAPAARQPSWKDEQGYCIPEVGNPNLWVLRYSIPYPGIVPAPHKGRSQSDRRNLSSMGI